MVGIDLAEVALAAVSLAEAPLDLVWALVWAVCRVDLTEDDLVRVVELQVPWERLVADFALELACLVEQALA